MFKQSLLSFLLSWQGAVMAVFAAISFVSALFGAYGVATFFGVVFMIWFLSDML